MPTYEYECEACGKHHEELQGMNDDPLTDCPHCGQPKLKRVIGAGAGLIFKGSGFYTTDYRSKEYKDSAKSDKPKSEGCGAGKACEGCPAAKKD